MAGLRTDTPPPKLLDRMPAGFHVFRNIQVKEPVGRMETEIRGWKKQCVHEDPCMGVRPQARVAMKFTL